MSQRYGITPEQEAFLNRFTCKRLRNDPDALKDLENYQTTIAAGSLASIRKNGLQADRKGTTAYYVVRDPDGKVVMFFSMKCGVMFDPEYQKVALLVAEGGAAKMNKMPADKMHLARFIMAPFLPGAYWALPPEEQKFVEICRDILYDKKKLPEEKGLGSLESHAAIELVDFCADDNAIAAWAGYGMGDRELKETIFWKFVVEKMEKIADLIGCEYAYLFAPNTEKIALVDYYQDALHFRKIEELGTFQSLYFVSCKFMCRRLRSRRSDDGTLKDESCKGLLEYRDEFFASFNPGSDDKTGGA